MSLAAFGRSRAATARDRWPLLLLLLVPAPALADDGRAPGDGSWAGNPALFSPVPLADAAEWTPVGSASDDALAFYRTDWSLATTGAFIRDGRGDRFKATFSPTLSLSHPGTRLSYGGTATARISRADANTLTLEQVLLSGTSTYEIAPLSRLVANLALETTRKDPNAADVASNVTATPVEISGSGDATYTQTFGRLDLSLKALAARDAFGPTTLAGGATLDNSSQDNTRFGGGLRVGYALAPGLAAFADAEATRILFDAPSPTLLTRLDGTRYTVKAGLAATFNPTLAATASVGLGLERFDDPALAEVRATLYDASLTYRPTEALALTGAFTTTLGAPGPDGTGTARLEYAMTAGAAYQVNDWLGWRASAAWHSASFAGTADTDRGYALGIGADYTLNRRVQLSADYRFEHAEVTPNPPDDAQTVTLGLTVRK